MLYYCGPEDILYCSCSYVVVTDQSACSTRDDGLSSITERQQSIVLFACSPFRSWPAVDFHLCSDCRSMLSWHSHTLCNAKESEIKWLQPWNWNPCLPSSTASATTVVAHQPYRLQLQASPPFPLRCKLCPDACRVCKRSRARWRSAVQ